MYSREYFYSIKKNTSNSIPLELKKNLEYINKILYNENNNNWREKKRFTIIKKDLSELEKVVNELKSFLNKLSSKNYDSLSMKILTIYKESINKPEIKDTFTTVLIDILFQNAVIQPIYCPIYVKLLNNIRSNSKVIDAVNNKINNFLTISSEDNIKKNETLSYDEFCENNKKKVFKKGYSKFIGELFLNNLITYSIIIENVNMFITNLNDLMTNNNTEFLEDNIICIDTLVRTIKIKLNKSDTEFLLQNINNFIKSKILIKRFKFKFMDLRDFLV